MEGVLVRCRLAVLLVSALLTLMTIPMCCGQATFRRACSCERSTYDGKCRFLLEAEMETTTHATPAGGAWLDARIGRLHTRLDTMEERTSTLEQAALKWMSRDVNGSSSTTSGVVDGNQEGVSREQGVALEELQLRMDSMEEMQQSILSRITHLELSPRICRRRGLLVSGTGAWISDNALTASSEFAPSHGAVKARLNVTGTQSAWCPKEPNQELEWLEFDLGQAKVIYQLVTKGRGDYYQWVTRYRIEYKLKQSEHWLSYLDPLGNDMIFTGNSDRETMHFNDLWSHLTTRFIRYIPLEGAQGNNKCMRADVVGCLDTDYFVEV